MRLRWRVVALLPLGLLPVAQARACSGTIPYTCTTSFTAAIGFDAPVTLAKVADMQFGTVLAARAATYTMSTSGGVTISGPGQLLSGAPAAGSIRITGSASQLVNISVGGYTANRGVTPANATCAYDGGASGSCAITGAAAPTVSGRTLLLGADVVVDGTQSAGTAATPSITILVVYQ